MEVAYLNTKSFHHLSGLQKAASSEWEALLPVRSLDSLTSRTGAIGPGEIAKLNLNVYGAAKMSDEIALKLARSGLYLQDPDSLPTGSTYENPQYLGLPADTMPYANMPDGMHDEEVIAAEFSSHGNSYDLDFDALLDRFARHSYLVQATVDSRIMTPLLE